MIRMLAWCGMNRSMSAGCRPARWIAVERGRRERPRREPVRLLALHPDVVLAARDRLGRRRALRPARRQPDHVRALRLGRQLDAEPAARLVRRRQHDRAGPVAEQDAGVPVGVVEEAGQQLRADDQDVLRQPARDVGVRRRVGVDEAGAGRRDVHRGRRRVADRLLDQGGRRGHPVVGRERREQDQVDLVGLEAGRADRPHRRRPRPSRRSSRGRPRRAARGSRSASRSTRRTCRPSARGRRWSGPATGA